MTKRRRFDADPLVNHFSIRSALAAVRVLEDRLQGRLRTNDEVTTHPVLEVLEVRSRGSSVSGWDSRSVSSVDDASQLYGELAGLDPYRTTAMCYCGAHLFCPGAVGDRFGPPCICSYHTSASAESTDEHDGDLRRRAFGISSTRKRGCVLCSEADVSAISRRFEVGG